MTATKTVVWGRYLKGEQAQRGAADYTRYVEYRGGDDRGEEGKRKFFDREEQGVDGEKVRELWQEQGKRGPVLHELILSPGLNTVDQQEYTREIMDKLSRAKGQELQWYAAEHKNTDHHHIHVLLAGKDAEGRGVRIDKNDHKHIKEWGDRYIDREHKLDRMLDRESERLVETRTHDRAYERDRGDALFDSLFSAVHDDKAHEKTQVKTEKREKEQKPEKPAYKVKEWDKDRAIAELPDENKIYRKDEAYSKYSSLDELKALDKALQSKEVERASKPEYAQLRQWIKDKERYGEDYYENKDRKDFDKKELGKFNKREKEREKERGREREDKKQSREAGREIREFDKKFRESYEPRQQGNFHRGVGRQQRVHELRGRTSEVHANYQMNLSRQRLQLAMEREPENRDNYQKELDWLNASYHDSIKDFEKLDLDSLFGGKDRDREDKKSGKEREPGEEDKERDKKQNRAANRDVQREIQEFDKAFRQSYEPKDGFNRGVGKQQRVHELYGRTSEVHANYQMNLSRQRLGLAMERDPENKDNYEKELEQLNESYRESLRDFDRLDLDSLFGDKGRQRDDERNDEKTGKEREPGDDRAEKKEGKERGEGKEQDRAADPSRERPLKTEERQQEDERQLEQATEEPHKETETKDITTDKTQEQREKEEREDQECRDREERGGRDDRGGR